MKYPPEPVHPPKTSVQEEEQIAVTIRGPIEFRFVLKFAAQLSTPCSRGLGIKPRADHLPLRHAPRLFKTYLQRHSVLQ